VSLNIPIKKVVLISLGAQVRHGKTESESTQTSNSRGTSQTISRSFKVKHMQRGILKWSGKKTYHGGCMIADKVTHEMSGEQRPATWIHDRAGRGWAALGTILGHHGARGIQ
jgi:hypothetical protein